MSFYLQTNRNVYSKHFCFKKTTTKEEEECCFLFLFVCLLLLKSLQKVINKLLACLFSWKTWYLYTRCCSSSYLYKQICETIILPKKKYTLKPSTNTNKKKEKEKKTK